MQRYAILMQTYGNKPELFAGNPYAIQVQDVLHYDIPGEALTDEKFRKMITEAEKYLGYPYVWGGASPSTSFDCSGFVSWVINHCGNGWNYGRLTAEGLRQVCDIIPASEAPGFWLPGLHRAVQWVNCGENRAYTQDPCEPAHRACGRLPLPSPGSPGIRFP